MLFISNVEADDDMLFTLANINLNEKIDLFCLAFIICLKLFDDASRCLKTFWKSDERIWSMIRFWNLDEHVHASEFNMNANYILRSTTLSMWFNVIRCTMIPCTYIANHLNLGVSQSETSISFNFLNEITRNRRRQLWKRHERSTFLARKLGTEGMEGVPIPPYPHPQFAGKSTFERKECRGGSRGLKV